MSTKNRPLLHGLVFVAGFGIVFALLGLSAGVLGRLVPALLPTMRVLGGVLLIVMGLATWGLTGWAAAQITRRPAWQASAAGQWGRKILESTNALLYADRRLRIKSSEQGYPASFLTGIAFSAGWAPCLGPLLAAILLLASEQETLGQGAALMAFYTAGLGIPFLLTAAALGRMSGVLNRVNRYSRAVSLVSGIFLVFTGGLLLSGRLLDVSASLIYYLGFGFGLEEILLGSTSLSLALAFLAGMLSFFSPCVLPLIPAYLGYMSGVSISVPAD